MNRDVSSIQQTFIEAVRAELGDDACGLWFEGQFRLFCDSKKRLILISNTSAFGVEWYRRNYRLLFERIAASFSDGPYQVQIVSEKELASCSRVTPPTESFSVQNSSRSEKSRSSSEPVPVQRSVSAKVMPDSGKRVKKSMNGRKTSASEKTSETWNRFQTRRANSTAILRDVERLNIPEVAEFLRFTEQERPFPDTVCRKKETPTCMIPPESLPSADTFRESLTSADTFRETPIPVSSSEKEEGVSELENTGIETDSVRNSAMNSVADSTERFLALMDRLDAEGVIRKSLSAAVRPDAASKRVPKARKTRKNSAVRENFSENIFKITSEKCTKIVSGAERETEEKRIENRVVKNTEKNTETAAKQEVSQEVQGKKAVKEVEIHAPAQGSRKLQELMNSAMLYAQEEEDAADVRASENAEKPHVRACTRNASQPYAVVSASSVSGGRVNRYGSFETFISGGSNRLAYTTAKSLISQMGIVSPIVFYGNTGVGKTHLLDAVYEQAAACGLKTVYTTGEDFMMEFVETVRDSSKKNAFLRTYRYCDLLIVDNLQFLLNKQSTTAEFLSIAANRMRSGRQIVLACDRPLEEMEGLGKDLCSYLRSGYWVQIFEPSFDVRLGILERQSRSRQIPITDDQCRTLAEKFTGDVRTILGAINTLDIMTRTQAAFPEITGFGTRRDREISQSSDLIQKFIRDLTVKAGRAVSLEEIKRIVAAQFGLDIHLLSSGKRIRKVSQPRMLAMWLARKYTRKPLSEIGEAFGCNSHSTVISAQKKVENWLTQDISLETADAPKNISDIMCTLRKQLESAL